MRDARFVGLASDGQALIVEHDGEHIRLPLDAGVRAAIGGQAQMPMPLEARMTPREMQHRIRCGESASRIAATTGVAVELVARFEGPVLAERSWHAEQAQKTVVDGTPLGERLATAAGVDAAEPDVADWDAWLAGDDGWRVRATLPDGRSAVWSWEPRTHRLRGRDDLARLALSGDAARDDLEAVLRPIAAARQASRPTVVPDVTDAASGAGTEQQPEEPAERRPAQEPRRSGGRRRAHVPSWDEIVLGSVPRRTEDEPPVEPPYGIEP